MTEKIDFENGKKKENAQIKPEQKENKTSAVANYSVTQKLVLSAKRSFENSNEYGLNFNREANFALQILEGNNYLLKATPESIKNAIVNVSLTGLSLNPALKYAYLVPRVSKEKGLQLVLDISYIGMIKILTDAGAVKNVDADVICQNDKYDFRKGTESYLKHSISLGDRGDVIGAYAIAYFRDGGSQFVVMNMDELHKVRATSESYKNEKTRSYSPWENWADEMYKKTCLKRLFKLLPRTDFSEQLIAAVSAEHEAEISDVKQEDRLANLFDEEQEAQIIE